VPGSPAGNVPPKISLPVVAPAVMKPASSAPAPPVMDPGEEKFRVREQALKQKERLVRIRRLEEEVQRHARSQLVGRESWKRKHERQNRNV
jgi:hypothetical protein